MPANNWSGTFTDLEEYKAGNRINYTVKEVPLAKGYESDITGDAINGYKVTNSRTPEKIVVSGIKTWVDDNNQYGKRPESITIRLLANGEKINSKIVTAADGWAWKFDDLPKFKAGEEITYVITEDVVDGYSADIRGYNMTNTYIPGKTSVQVTNAWRDANNQDGVRPDTVVVKLLADGVYTGNNLILSKANNWTGVFKELEDYKDGRKVVYNIEVLPVGGGYITDITGGAKEGFVVINTRIPAMVDVSGSKIWDDVNNQDGKRPTSITIRLLKNGLQIDNRTVTATDNWEWSFKELPKYEAGEEITYTITEDAIEEYSADISGYNVTNSYTPEKTSVQVTKAWIDANDNDGKRTKSVSVQLFADGEVVADKVLTLNKSNNWTGTFTNLPINNGGKVIVYTVDEVDMPEGYTREISGNATVGFIISNCHDPETISVEGAKTWDDNNQNEKRPASITIHCLRMERKLTNERNCCGWLEVGLYRLT